MQTARTGWMDQGRHWAAIVALAALAFAASAAPPRAAISGTETSVPPVPGHRGSGNYLIVTAPDYASSAVLSQFANAKAAMGFDVMTYVVPSGTSNTAIKSYIRNLWGTPDAPAYVLIVGDTDGASSTASTIPHFTGGGARHASTDLPYGCMDSGDDWYPEIHIGRFSVRSVSQLQDVVNKTLFVEAGDYPDPTYVKRAAFLATNDTTSGAEETHNYVIETYMIPAEFSCRKIYARVGGGTQDITNAVNAGSLFVVYFGHSSSSGWSTPAFNQSNVQALTNNGLYGLACGWSCNSAHYSYDECFGETWQRVANRGAAAYLSSSDLIYWGEWEDWEESRWLEKYFFQSIFGDGIREVRPAWDAALYRLLDHFGSGNPRIRDFFEEFVLLGDPALYLPEGDGFRLVPDPVAQSLCAPPASAAVYSVEVQETGHFDEAVTLSATDLPPGASVSFTANSLPPPFTTVMTVDNIQGGSPGSYNITLTGTALSLQRSVALGLSLSTTLPGAVALSSPPDGAVGVARKPTLTWEAASQAVQYEVQVAADPDFNALVDEATVVGTSRTLSDYLDPLTLYYWHVRATNGCGVGDYSQTFAFSTMAQPDYFTEQFAGDFDLDNFTVELVPDGSGDYYAICGGSTTVLPTDPAGGTTLPLVEDDFVHVSLAGGQTVSLYGVSYSAFYVGANGYLTFNSGDTTYDESLTSHFSQPRISALFEDLTPSGGTVSWIQLADRAAVTFQNVPVYGTGNRNTFQFELLFNGEIHLTWLRIDATSCIAGLSAGGGLPGDYLESNLSAAGPCGPDFELLAVPLSQDVCIPADAVYTVTVEPVGGMTDPVTLSASGGPSGTTVHFSVNPVTPPGSTVLTIGNTSGAAAGSYQIQITGIAGGVQHSATVGLNLSASVPGVVVLAQPPNGAQDVPLQPALSWQAATGALRYDLQVATDASFANVVYSATEAGTGHTLASTLEGGIRYHWRVRGVDGCGTGPWSAAFSFTTLDQLMPASYDMLNGQTGSYTYFDDTYDGAGDPTQPLSPLSGGLGDLTDGVIATQSWNVTPGPYVGWVSVDPTITFHFAHWVRIRSIVLHVDDSNGQGGVYPPTSVTLAMGGGTPHVYPVTDPPAGTPFAIVVDELALMGDTLAVTLSDNNPNRYMMLSEVEMFGRSCVGDLNCDGAVNNFDISPFVLALSSTPPTYPEYYAAWPQCEHMNGDINGDGAVNNFDISPFVELLTQG